MSWAPILLSGVASKALERQAIDEAARLLCRVPTHAAAERESCNDCRRVLERKHPDLLIVAPEADRRSNVPQFAGGGSKETTIPAALLRAMVAEAALRPYEGARRVLILLDADRTETAAFSALLKVLEEPPTASCFILTAVRPRLLPETILSRVVHRKVRGTSRRETARILETSGVPREEAQARAAFAPDDVATASRLDLAAERQVRDDLLEAVTGLLLTRSAGWGIALASRLPGEDAVETVSRLGLLAVLLRDAAVAAIDPAGEAVVHRERFRDLARLGSGAGQDLLEVAGRALELAATLSDSRRNARLSAEGFALALVRTGAGASSRDRR